MDVFPDLTFVTAATIFDKAADYDLHVIDANADRILPVCLFHLLHTSYDIIIIKSTQYIFELDVKLSVKLKKEFPNAKLYFAGYISKLLKNWISHNAPSIDSVIDEPLDFFVYKLVYAVDHVDMNRLPCPDYTLFPYDKYTNASGKIRLVLQASRGCRMNCSYCPYYHFYDGNVYDTDIDVVINNIKEIILLKPDVIQFRDQYFTGDKDYIKRLCNRMIEEKIDIKWSCETRIDSLDKGLIDLMVEAGMESICFGIESGNDKLLNRFNRRYHNINDMKRIAAYLKQKRICTLAFYMLGLPEETWESAEMTFRRACEIDSDRALFFKYQPIDYAQQELTPDKFPSLKHEINKDDASILDNNEIDYMINTYTAIYNYKKVSLEEDYKYWKTLYRNRKE